MFTIQVYSLKLCGRDFPLSKMVLLKKKKKKAPLKICPPPPPPKKNRENGPCLASCLTDSSRLMGGSVWRAGLGSHESGKIGIIQSLRHKKGLLSHQFYSIVTPLSWVWEESKAIKQFTVSSVLLHALESRHVWHYTYSVQKNSILQIITRFGFNFVKI